MVLLVSLMERVSRHENLTRPVQYHISQEKVSL